MPDGMRRRMNFAPLTYTVCPALCPPWYRATIENRGVSRSTILPFPSSPHCAPRTARFIDSRSLLVVGRWLLVVGRWLLVVGCWLLVSGQLARVWCERGVAESSADDVLERHVDDGDGDEHLDERRKPERVGREIVRRRDERDRVRDGELGHDGDERPQPAERDHEAEEKQQMIRAVEDVLEPEADDMQRRLVPPRIESHDARIAFQLEGAHRS